MSDRVAVMSGGRVEQIGTPEEVYESPSTLFVADFLGISNLMDAESVAAGNGECTVRIGEFTLRAGCGELTARGPVKVVARPERLKLLEHGAEAGNCLPGMIDRTVYVGAALHVIVRLATGDTLQASIANTGDTDGYRQGTPVAVHVPADALRVLTAGRGSGAAEPEAAGDTAADDPARAPQHVGSLD
jgi:ABC-type Fe3+/spermidine/putrescine transport system ATPase subunit